MSQEIFTVNLKNEPSPELREKLRRYLHIRYAGPRQRAYDPELEGAAYMHNRTVIKLFKPSSGKPWRITCFSTDPSLGLVPKPQKLKSGQRKKSYPQLNHLKDGTEIKVGQGASEAQKMERQVRDILGANAA